MCSPTAHRSSVGALEVESGSSAQGGLRLVHTPLLNHGNVVSSEAILGFVHNYGPQGRFTGVRVHDLVNHAGGTVYLDAPLVANSYSQGERVRATRIVRVLICARACPLALCRSRRRDRVLCVGLRFPSLHPGAEQRPRHQGKRHRQPAVRGACEACEGRARSLLFLTACLLLTPQLFDTPRGMGAYRLNLILFTATTGNGYDLRDIGTRSRMADQRLLAAADADTGSFSVLCFLCSAPFVRVPAGCTGSGRQKPHSHRR